MSGAGWQPVHHIEADDPDDEPAKGPTVKQREGKSEGKSAAVGLTLNLPPDFISAMWGYGDQVMRLAMAVEEQTKATEKLIQLLTKQAAPIDTGASDVDAG